MMQLGDREPHEIIFTEKRLIQMMAAPLAALLLTFFLLGYQLGVQS